MELTDENFEDEVLDQKGLVFVDFWGSWCLACQQMRPIVKKLKESVDGVKVRYLNIDKNPKTAGRFEIEETPTHILFKDGKPINREVAAATMNQLKEMIEQPMDLNGK